MRVREAVAKAVFSTLRADRRKLFGFPLGKVTVEVSHVPSKEMSP
jgi:hypothetical protein